MTQPSIDEKEIEHFSNLAALWWDPSGKFGVLHKFNPVRLAYIRDQLCTHLNRNALEHQPLSGLRLVDIGCGGGLLSEPMARLGANVTAIDPSEKNIKTALAHAQQQGLSINYRAITAEALAETGEQFDVVLAMEVIEHVADRDSFIATCSTLLRPQGIIFMATINRTLKAYALAIIAAEHILRWLPKGTHSYDKLVRPQELNDALARNGIQTTDCKGVVYNPLRDEWRQSQDCDVNYMIMAIKE